MLTEERSHALWLQEPSYWVLRTVRDGRTQGENILLRTE
jgi:hypothetical protein